MDRLEATGDKPPRTVPPTVEVDSDRIAPLRKASRGFDERTLAELSRLRAAMGFITPSQAIPRVIDGRYAIVRSLGSGGMGVVYLAEDTKLDNTQVALKVVRESYLRDVPTAPLKLRREAQQMAKLRGHAHVVTVLDVGNHAGTTYLTMEHVAGTDLRRWSKAKPRTHTQILQAYLGAARGLRAAHDIGLVHRDFKPDNVLIGAGEVAKVTDFGIAGLAEEHFDTEVDTSPDVKPHHAVTSVLRGTLAYMSPEQLMGERADARSDQFSFCVALWETLTGELPYKWRTPQSQAEALCQPPKGIQHVPRWLRRTLRKGLSRERGDRHRDMRTLIELIERGLERPRKLIRASSIGGGLLIAGAAGVFAHELANPPPPPPTPTCELFVSSVSEHWDAGGRTALAGRGEALEVDVSWTIQKLDELSEKWSAAAADICDGDQAPPVEDLERRCLDGWLVSFNHAIELLTTRGDQQTLAGAPDLLATIDPPNGDFCTRTLARLPRDPELTQLVEGARSAAVFGDRTRAEALSRLAVERARAISSEEPYSSELAQAHAARAYVLKLGEDFEEATTEFGVAEAHAIGATDLDTLLYVRVMWAQTLALMLAEESARAAELELERALPLLHAAEVSDDALIRGELLETRALIDKDLGRPDEATVGYSDAAEFYGRVGNTILAARATILRGIVELEHGQLAKSEADLRWGLAQLESENVPPDYPRLLGAAYNLAVVLFERSFEVEAELGQRYADESLMLLERVVAQASPPWRLAVLGTACQIAAQTPHQDRLRAFADQALAALRAGEETDDRYTVEAQVALAMMIGLHDAEAEARVKELLARVPPLPLELRWALARDWVEYLEREGRCEEAKRSANELGGFEEIEDFQQWKSDRPGGSCM